MLNRFAAQRAMLSEHPGMVLDEHNGKVVRLPGEIPIPEFTVERWTDILPELRELFPLHWHEIGAKANHLPLEMNYPAYDLLDRVGCLHVVVARAPKQIVGYHISMLQPHLHSRSTLTALTDIYYLHPDYRLGLNGYRMLKYACEKLRELGVKRLFMGTTMVKDLGPILERLGFEPIETHYAKVM